MFRKRIALVVSAAALGSLSLVSPAEANHSWGNYHWASPARPFTLQVGNNVTTTWTGYFTTAVGQWSDGAAEFNLAVVPGQANPKRCNATSGRIEVCNASYGKNGWLGLASIWASGSHITQATTKLNDSYFSTAKYNTFAWRAMVTCQEIGHDFGLAHQNEVFDNPNTGSCMDYTNDPTGASSVNGPLANVAPNAHDFEQLTTIYGHTDSATTVGAATSGSTGSVGDDPSSWGREVSRSADGRVSVFERDLGNDNVVLTHVTWADDAASSGRAHAPE